MQLPARERSIVVLLARFGQLTASHINALLFGHLASPTPCQRSLARLLDFGLIERLHQRVVGGSMGGSGRHVYVLSQAGQRLAGLPRNRQRAVNFHTLAVADCAVALLELQRAGHIAIKRLQVEDEAWVTIAGNQLRPDMYAELLLPSDVLVQHFYEIDMGTEAHRQLRGKLDAYERAYNDSDAAQLPVFPRTIWVAVDEERAKELRWLISQGSVDAQKLFQVVTRDQLPQLFQG